MGGKGGNPQLDLAAPGLKLDLAVLGQPPLGDIEFSQNLQTGDQWPFVGKGDVFIMGTDAVNAKTDRGSLLAGQRFDVDIGGVAGHRILDDLVGHLHHNSIGGAADLLIVILAPVGFLDNLKIFENILPPLIQGVFSVKKIDESVDVFLEAHGKLKIRPFEYGADIVLFAKIVGVVGQHNDTPILLPDGDKDIPPEVALLAPLNTGGWFRGLRVDELDKRAPVIFAQGCAKLLFVNAKITEQNAVQGFTMLFGFDAGGIELVRGQQVVADQPVELTIFSRSFGENGEALLCIAIARIKTNHFLQGFDGGRNGAGAFIGKSQLVEQLETLDLPAKTAFLDGSLKMFNGFEGVIELEAAFSELGKECGRPVSGGEQQPQILRGLAVKAGHHQPQTILETGVFGKGCVGGRCSNGKRGALLSLQGDQSFLDQIAENRLTVTDLGQQRFTQGQGLIHETLPGVQIGFDKFCLNDFPGGRGGCHTHADRLQTPHGYDRYGLSPDREIAGDKGIGISQRLPTATGGNVELFRRRVKPEGQAAVLFKQDKQGAFRRGRPFLRVRSLGHRNGHFFEDGFTVHAKLPLHNKTDLAEKTPFQIFYGQKRAAFPDPGCRFPFIGNLFREEGNRFFTPAG